MAATFVVRGTIADIDETTYDEPCHPGTALIIEAADAFCRVIGPRSVLGDRFTLLSVGRPVEVIGNVFVASDGCYAHHVAGYLRLAAAPH